MKQNKNAGGGKNLIFPEFWKPADSIPVAMFTRKLLH
jgi:hypothetical protein